MIIDDFIRSAQPVGSRVLSKKRDINLSSATIRNEMADLEERGFIEKTHTSSGRIPSQKGYRYYVDHLLSPAKLTKADIFKIQSIFAEKIFEFEKIVQNSAKILSNLTNYTAIVLGPDVKENRLKKLQIVPLNKETAIALIVTDTGHVEHRMFLIPPSMKASEIEKMVNIINDRLIGVPLADLTDKIYLEVAALLRQHINNYEFILQSMVKSLKMPVSDKVFFGGKTNMLRQPEFHDIDKISVLLNMIEQEDGITDLLTKNPTGIHVKIGRENENIAMENCSLITATYSVGAESLGTIAILGPTRMKYSRVISILELLSDNLSTVLTRLYQNNE